MDHPDLRRYRRANLEPGVVIQFRAGGRFFMGLPVTCMGALGCSVEIASMLATSLQPEDALDRIVLQHPDLPHHLLQGKVSWIRGKHPDPSKEAVLLGIEYVDPPEEFTATVDRYVTALLRENTEPHRL